MRRGLQTPVALICTIVGACALTECGTPYANISNPVCFRHSQNGSSVPFTAFDGQPLRLTAAECAQRNQVWDQQEQANLKAQIEQTRRDAMATQAASTPDDGATMWRQPTPAEKAANPALETIRVQPHWTNVITQNGVVYQIDLNSIYRPKSSTAIFAMTRSDEGSGFKPENYHGLLFWCPDHMTFARSGPLAKQVTPMIYLTPDSIGRQLADIACANADHEPN